MSAAPIASQPQLCPVITACLAAAALILCGILQAGCAGEARASGSALTTSRPSFSVTGTEYGPNIFVTSKVFFRRFPELRAHVLPPELPPLGTSRGAYGMSDSSSGPVVLGCFDVSSPRACWAIAADPAHPTDGEREVMEHEACHRLEFQRGWEAAAPRWAALYRSAPWSMTHREIRTRLINEGFIQ